MKSCMIIAGEKSGEDHAMSFVPYIMKNHPGLKFYGVGGEALKGIGVELLYHLKDFSSWGISEVVEKIPFYFKALDRLEREAIERDTKVAIVIDFQDFNLRLAQRLKKRGVNVLYYVAPQAWGWRPWRAKTLAKCVHTLFTILPFEKKWFQERGVGRVKSIIHPVLTEYKSKIDSLDLGLHQKPFYNDLDRPLKVLLLPGSRNFEVALLLEEFHDAIIRLQRDLNIEVSIVKSSSVRPEIFKLNEFKYNSEYTETDLVKALTEADLCIAASGTVTLTTALFEIPTVVCYKASLLSEMVYELLAIYKGPMSLANIVHEEIVFPELKQGHVHGYGIYNLIKKWTSDKDAYMDVKKKLSQTKNKISGDDFDVAGYMESVILESYSLENVNA